jgi:DNA polymerase-3 subunit delta'
MNRLYPWQDELWQRWLGLRARLPHAILLKGPQGVGKFDFALNIAQSLLCREPQEGGLACDSCPSCHWFQQQSHPDFRLIQPEILSAQEEASESGKKPARQISVDQVRGLADFSSLSAHQGGFRVVLIHPAEAMNASAANALLKTLEEPAGQMLFILVTHKPQQLPATILSRCLALAAPLPPEQSSTAWLERQGISEPASLLAQAGFAPLLAARLAEETEDAGEYARFLQEIARPSQLDVFALAEHLQRTEPAKVIHWMQQWCHDLASARLAGQVRYHAALSADIRSLAGRIGIFDLLHFQKELQTARREAAHPLNPKLQFESLLLGYRRMMLAAGDPAPC